MISLKYFVYSIFLWFPIKAQQQFVEVDFILQYQQIHLGNKPNKDKGAYTIVTYKNLYTNALKFTKKLSYANRNKDFTYDLIQSDEALNYFKFSKEINLKLTRKRIIYPFHFFT